MAHYEDDEPVAIDPLFLGLTRPTMAFGVTYTYFVLNGLATTIAFLALNSPWAWLIGIPVHLVGVIACLKEVRFFDLWRVRLLTTPNIRNRRLWRANSYRP